MIEVTAANYINETGTLLVQVGDDGRVHVARRPEPDAVWGPMIECFPERGYPTITGMVFGPAPGDELRETLQGPPVEPAGIGSEGQPIVGPNVGRCSCGAPEPCFAPRFGGEHVSPELWRGQ